MASLFENLINTGGQLATAYLPYEASGEQINAIKSMTESFLPKAAQLGEQTAAEARFKPFAVKTATGTTDVGAEGGYTQTLGQQPQAIQTGLMGRTQQLMGQAPVTAQGLFSQLQAMRQPEMDRQRLEMENRLAAQGRLGTRTAAYGGTPEALAMEKAFQEQQSADLFNAMQLAPTLEGQQLQNIESALGTAYIPQQQELLALTPAAQLSNVAQAGRQGVTEALYKSGIAGLQAQAEGTGATAALEAARTKSLADALSGLFGVQAAGLGYGAGGTSSVGQLANMLMGGGSAGTSPDTSGTIGGLLGGLGNYLFGDDQSSYSLGANSAAGGFYTGNTGLYNDGLFGQTSYYDPMNDFWAD